MKNNIDGDNYPILKSLMIVKIYMVARLAMIIATASFFLGIIWHIIVMDLLEDQYKDPNDPSKGVKTSFKESLDPADGKVRTLVKVWYFSLTTLSTIGYGDYSPQSTDERLISVLILLLGVMMFSFIMSQFIEILMNYQSLWQVGNHRDLSKWISLLSRFNQGHPLGKNLVTRIEDFFDYYWQNNRLSCFSTNEDIRFMDELPAKVQGEIFVDYLFVDFLYDYREFFNPSKKSRIAEEIIKRKLEDGSVAITSLKLQGCTWKLFAKNKEDQNKRLFLVDFVKKLEPRYYNS